MGNQGAKGTQGPAHHGGVPHGGPVVVLDTVAAELLSEEGSQHGRSLVGPKSMDVGLHLLAEVHVEAARLEGRVAVPTDIGCSGLFQLELVLDIGEVRVGVGRGVDPSAEGELGRAQAQVEAVLRGTRGVGVEPGEVQGEADSWVEAVVKASGLSGCAAGRGHARGLETLGEGGRGGHPKEGNEEDWKRVHGQSSGVEPRPSPPLELVWGGI